LRKFQVVGAEMGNANVVIEQEVIPLNGMILILKRLKKYIMLFAMQRAMIFILSKSADYTGTNKEKYL
jgi:hypothetical protein